MGVTRCHFKSIFPSAAAQRSATVHGNVSAHQPQLCQKAWNREEASPHYPRHDAGRACGPGRSRKLLPTLIFQCRLAPHLCGAQVQYRVNGLAYVVLSSPRTLVENGRSVCVELSQIPARPSASVQKIKVATMRCGCTRTLSAISMLTSHEENTNSGSSSKKGPAYTPANKEKGRYDDESDRSLSSLSSLREPMLL